MSNRYLLLIAGLALVPIGATEPNSYEEAARELDRTVAAKYAYRHDLPGGFLPTSLELERQRNSVSDDDTLLRYAEARITSLADHHAITGSSFRDSWAVVPTYADMWVVEENGRVIVEAVRADSPASAAGIAAGDRIISVAGTPVNQAIENFWSDMGLAVTPVRADYTARVLLAGRRDRLRRFTVESVPGELRQVTLVSLYDVQSRAEETLEICSVGQSSIIRFNNSLGDKATIRDFDEALRHVPEGNELFLDLRDTPSGGNTTVARAIMGWFVREARPYQIHDRPAEQRETGIAHQWVEQVLPRDGKYRPNLPTVLVGRWTGSMGEGLAIGFHALGAEILGTQMAGLKGSIEDFTMPDTDLTVKLPTERLFTVDGLPRENFLPEPISENGEFFSDCR